MNKVQAVFAFSMFSFVAGCTAFVLPDEPAADAGVAPAADGGSVVPAVDAGPAAVADAGMPAPGTDAGVAPVTPDAGPPAAVDAGVAPTTRFCGDGQIGTRARITFAAVPDHRVQTFAGHDLSATNTGFLVYTSAGAPTTFVPGDTVEFVIYTGGTLNIHPMEGGSLAFDTRLANLQHISSATDDVSGEERGFVLDVLRDGTWQRAEGFLWFGWDTQPGVLWPTASGLPSGERIGRLLMNLDCVNQGKVYVPETLGYRPAR